MPRKRNTEKDDLFPVTPTSDWKDPATPHAGKKRKVYTSGTLYQQETGRYSTPGISDQGGVSSHGKKKTVDTGSWNNKKVSRGNAVPGASRGVGQPTIDGFIEGLERRKKGKGARR